jgi:hypothetical protein
MKKNLRLNLNLALATTLLLTVLTSPAQGLLTSTNPAIAVPITPLTVPGLINTFTTFVTTEDTNLAFQDIIVWDGPVYQSQINIANELGASLDVWHSHPALTTADSGTLFAAPEIRLRQGAIAGAFVSENAGGEFGWQIHDLRVGVFADGVYRNQLTGSQSQRLGFEGGVFADKMFGKNSGIGLFLSEQTGSAIPLIGLNVNLTFGNRQGFLGIF